MTKSDTTRFFDINRTSATPLYIQVREGLCRWLTILEKGQRLPAERRLASLVQVDRTTVRKACRELVATGVLTRNTKGTFVMRRPKDRTGPQHSFALQTGASRSLRTSLRIVLFENYPTQQNVWTRIVDLFNREHPTLALEIEWLPVAVNTFEFYREFITTRRPDVVLLSGSFARRLKQSDMLVPLPGDLAQDLRGPEYYSCIAGADVDSLLSYVVPMHVSPWGVIWNESLVRTRTNSVVTELDHSKLVRWMTEMAPALPKGSHLLACGWNLPLIKGIPPSLPTVNNAQHFFLDLLEATQSLGRWHDKITWAQNYAQQSPELFAAGNAAFYLDNLNYFFTHLASIPIPWKGSFIIPEKGWRLPAGWSCVAVPRQSQQPLPASIVVRFLASKPAQDEIALGHINAAFRRASNRHLLAFMRGSDEASMHASLESLSLGETQDFDWQTFVHNELRLLCQEIIAGRYSLAEAAALAADMMKLKFAEHLPAFARASCAEVALATKAEKPPPLVEAGGATARFRKTEIKETTTFGGGALPSGEAGPSAHHAGSDHQAKSAPEGPSPISNYNRS